MIYFRVDANKNIATGHLMRCIAIANNAKKRGEEVTFLIADENPIVILDSFSFDYIVLDSNWNNLDSEIDIIIKIIKDRNIKKLFIDSYYVTSKYLSALTSYTETIYIDDLNLFTYNVSNLICYEYYYSDFNYNNIYKNADVKLLLGPEYTPLRSEFSNIPVKKIKKYPENILILSGGTDNHDIFKRLLNSVDFSLYKSVNIICGKYYLEFDSIVNAVKNRENIHIYQSVHNIIDYMQAADIAISAGGITLYELCACGTPTISYILADNQKNNAIAFNNSGAIRCAGDVRDNKSCECFGYDSFESGVKCLLDIYKSNDYRLEMSNNIKKIVDGFGCDRILDAII